MVDEKKITLWCTKCQRGVGGNKLESILKPGDDCPWCFEKEDMKGPYAELDKVTKLRTTDDVAEEDRKYSELKKYEAKIIRGQDTPGELRAKLNAEFESKLKAQNDAHKAELDELRALINKSNKKVS
jgi:hypothetical protein